MTLRTWVTCALALLGACSDPPGPEPEAHAPGKQAPPGPEPEKHSPTLSAALVSSAIVPSTAASNAAVGGGQAYVSMVAGTDGDGRRVDVYNLRNGASATSPMTSGGFDPVAVEAEAGDTLSVTVVHEAGNGTTAYRPVPIKSRPRVVRTSPARGKTDVPLNSLIIVVFSEPMDSTSLRDALHLRQDGAEVPGTVIWELKDGVILSGRFVPTTPLAPLSTYELSVATAARSPNGTPLDAGLTVEFTTGASAGLARRFAYVWQGTVVVSNLDGSAPVALAEEASRPAWSPDGARIAFTRPTNNRLANWQLCVARADGSDARCVIGDRDGGIQGRPSWSPDGSKIAFTLFVYSCPNGQCGQLGGFFTSLRVLNTATMVVDTVATPPLTSVSWSPDGSKIAFIQWGAGTFGRGALGIVNPDGSELEILAPSLGSYSVSQVAWSPDGRRLALALRDEHVCPWYCDTAIGVVEADASQLRVLATGQVGNDTYLDWPAWSPDGASIAFQISEGDVSEDTADPGTDILVVSADGGASEVLVSGGGLPSWRP